MFRKRCSGWKKANCHFLRATGDPIDANKQKREVQHPPLQSKSFHSLAAWEPRNRRIDVWGGSLPCSCQGKHSMKIRAEQTPHLGSNGWWPRNRTETFRLKKLIHGTYTTAFGSSTKRYFFRKRSLWFTSLGNFKKIYLVILSRTPKWLCSSASAGLNCETLKERRVVMQT